MKNFTQLAAALTLVAAVGLGCSFMSGGDERPSQPQQQQQANSNKTLTDKAIDSTVGSSKIGIADCDQVMEAIEVELNNPDDNFALKAAKAVVLNQFKDAIRQSFEQNPNDKENIARTCREIKTQFDSYKAKEQSGSAN